MDGAFISPSNPLNVAAFPPRLVHLHCLQVGPKVSPTPLEGMCRVWLVLTCGQMLQISSRPSYKSVWGEVYVNWLLLGKREFTFLSCCQWTYRWCFFQTVYFFLPFIQNTGTLCFHVLWLSRRASWISCCAIEVDIDSMYGMHWRRLGIALNNVSDYQLTKWRG